MAQRRLSMRKIKEILRLKYEAKLTNRQIAQSCKLARSTIATYLERAGGKRCAGRIRKAAMISPPSSSSPCWASRMINPSGVLRSGGVLALSGHDGERTVPLLRDGWWLWTAMKISRMEISCLRMRAASGTGTTSRGQSWPTCVIKRVWSRPRSAIRRIL